MELTIRTSNKQQEKYLIAFLKSVDIDYVQAKKEIKPKSKKQKSSKGNVLEFVTKWSGSLKGIENNKDEKVQRILNKHK
jgi:hypothetical protein